MGFFGKLLGKMQSRVQGEYPQVQDHPQYPGTENFPNEIGSQKTEDANINTQSGYGEANVSTENPSVHPELDSFDAYNDRQIPAQVQNTSREEYLGKFRSEFRYRFPKSLDTIESHMQLPYMVGSAVDISPIIEYASNNVYERFRNQPEKLSELSRAAVAKVAMELEQYIGSRAAGDFALSLKRAHEDSLEKAWIVLDFYCRMLKAEYTENIAKLHGMITDELILRSTDPVHQAQSESYEEVLAKCAKAISEDNDASVISELKKRLFQKLMHLDSIYVIHDATFNNAFPYIGADGRLEIQTSPERAESLKAFLEKNGDSRVDIVEYKKEEYESFFSKVLHHGLAVIRIDNGFTPVEVDIAGLFDNGEKNLIEVCNRYARGRFVSELQYGYRIKNLLDDRRDSEDYRVLSSAMVSARTNGYRALAGGLLYVFNIGGAKCGTTLYTQKALETAGEIMKAMGIIDESTLIAHGDSSFDVFTGEIAPRVIKKKSSTAGKGFVCAFTDKENADKIHKRLTDAGANDAVIVMTLGELCENCGDHAGFILDMSSYGLEVPIEVFGRIGECVKTNGIIVDGKEMEF